jgi:hypothetical protein
MFEARTLFGDVDVSDGMRPLKMWLGQLPDAM